LSIDPVTTDANTGGSFNRYAYANNSPYKYIDPDGRDPGEAYKPLLFRLSTFEGAKRDITLSQAIANGAVTRDAVGTPAIAIADAVVAHGGEIIGAIGSIRSGRVYVPGARFSPSTKSTTAKNADNKCEFCGKDTVAAKKSETGVTPPKNEGQTDHVVPASKGGTNSPDNAAHTCRECNIKNSDTLKPHPRDGN
jgi:hypothetical protein